MNEIKKLIVEKMTMSRDNPEEVNDILLNHSDPKIRARTASRGDLTDTQYVKASKDEDPGVQLSIAKHKQAPYEARKNIQKKASTWKVKKALIDNHLTEHDIRLKMASDENPDVVHHLARSQFNNLDTQMKLASSKNDSVPALLASQSYIHRDVFKKLQNHKSEEVRNETLKNKTHNKRK